MAKFLLSKKFHPDFLAPGVKPVGPVVVDWENPLSRGLQICIPLSASSQMDLISGLVGTQSNTPDMIGKRGGLEIITGNIQYQAIKPSIVNLADGYTLGAVVAAPFFDDDGYEVEFGAINGENGSAFNFIAVDFRGSQWSNPAIANTGTTLRIGGITTSRTATGLASDKNREDDLAVGFSYDGATRRTWFGSTEDAFSETGAFAGNTEFSLVIGARNTTDSTARAVYKFVCLWDRALTTEEWLLFDRDPYQVLKPAVPIIAQLPAAAPSGRIMGSIANQGGLAGHGGIAGPGGGLAG